MAVDFFSGFNILRFFGFFDYFAGFLHKFGNSQMVLSFRVFFMFCFISLDYRQTYNVRVEENHRFYKKSPEVYI